MQDPKLDIISVFRFEKRLKVFIAVYLSIILLSITLVLVKFEIASELQQVLIIILGLITVATLDAFRKALENSPSSFINEFKQIIVQEGASYTGDIDKRVIVENGNYVADGSINYGGFEKRQTLAEAAAEIQELLKQLEKSNPSATEAEKVAYVNDEAEPDLKSRVVNALKSGGEAAIESYLDSHYINIIKAVMEGWLSSR